MIALFVLGMILLAAGVVLFLFSRKAKKKILFVLIGGILLGLSLLLSVFSCLRTVPTGHTGIVTVFGKVEDKTYEAGVHFTAPWVEVINMDNRNQKASVELSCFSSDIQEVSVTYTLNYQISKANAQTIYKEIDRGPTQNAGSGKE